MKNQTSTLKRVYSSELTVITEGNEVVHSPLVERLSPKNTDFIVSPKQNNSQKENLNIYHMSSD